MLVIFTVILYLVAIVMLWRRIKGHHGQVENPSAPRTGERRALIALLLVITLLHGWQVYARLTSEPALNLALGLLVSLVCLMTLVLFLLASLRRPMLNLGIFVMPLGLAGFLLGMYAEGEAWPIGQAPRVLWLHLSIAVLAFGVLCIAAAQALLLYVQERKLQHPKPGMIFPALPPIQTMESNLVLLTLMGVALLTVNLATGMWSLWQVSGKSLEFNHHILLSFVAWFGFSMLLLGRKLFGWRGQVAAKWTLIAFLVLVLAYFGSRFVSSIILS